MSFLWNFISILVSSCKVLSKIKSLLHCVEELVMQSLVSKWCRARGRWNRKFRLYHQFLRKSRSPMYDGLQILKGLGLPLIWLYLYNGLWILKVITPRRDSQGEICVDSGAEFLPWTSVTVTFGLPDPKIGFWDQLINCFQGLDKQGSQLCIVHPAIHKITWDASYYITFESPKAHLMQVISIANEINTWSVRIHLP